MTAPSTWLDPAHVERYRTSAITMPHRDEGEAVLLEFVPRRLGTVVDLGCGDGHLLALVLEHAEVDHALALDLSPPMLAKARERFAGRPEVDVIEHDLARPLPVSGPVDLVVSSLAIHHLEHDRKRTLAAEVAALLAPGGAFLDLDHVASGSPALRRRFLGAIGYPPDWDDPSNRLAAVEPQLAALRAAGFEDVDCAWKWLELALLVGRRPDAAA